MSESLQKRLFNMILLLLPKTTVSVQYCLQSMKSGYFNFEKISDYDLLYYVLKLLSNFSLAFF